MLKTIWIIGASSGIGYELTKLYLKNDYQVIASSRQVRQSEDLQSLSLAYATTLSLVDVDVSELQSIKSAAQKASKAYGKIDICFYNAGVYESMKVDSWEIEKFESMNQINYMGAVRVVNVLVPFFKHYTHGHFVFNLSISSYFGLPYGGGYSAPKAALLNFCESIQPELELDNIAVSVINHGFVKTRLTAKNDFVMPQLLEPCEAAKKIYDALEGPYRFEIKFPFLLSTFLYFLKIIPYKFAFYFTKKTL